MRDYSRYPVQIVKCADDEFVASCPLLPEVQTSGETEEQALQMAEDAIKEAILAREARGEPVPEA